MASYNEPVTELSPAAREIHRGLASIIEELEAIDWYHQRIDVSGVEDLKAVLTHNRDEEIEHMSMVLEWVRRQMPEFDQQLRRYLFTSAPLTEIERAAEEGTAAPSALPSGGGDLGIGKLAG
jgi:ferritin-like protein